MIHRVWQLLLSVRTALVLILLLAAGTLAGTLVAQAPAAVPLTGPAHDQWLEGIRPRFGVWTDALAYLGVFNVFRTWWYEALLAALALSITACSVHRAGVLWRESYRPHLRLAASMFDRPATAAATAAGDERASAASLRGALARRGYRVVATERDGVTHVYADRHRIARFGTLVSHLSLVLLLVAAGVGAHMRWDDDGLLVPEGSTRDVGLDGLAVHADSFVAEYYPSGEPKDYRADVVLYRNGGEVERKTIRVNDPLEYDGVRFYQSFFGPAAEMRVTDASGRVVYDDGVALAWRVDGDRPAGTIALVGTGLTAFVVAPSTGGSGDVLIRPGEMRVELYRSGSSSPVGMRNVTQGGEVELAGLRFAFVRERQFTGLRVARDPTLPLVAAASVLFVLGLATVFALPYRRLWARVSVDDAGTRIAALTVGRRTREGRDELTEIVREAAAAAPKE
ncbi:MAG: cytochrome c biogenesis protein ResB [Chloroflexi bacterium]|nr:cytochrome c biogenesis protein ResB [Chloroflexota bacterium]